MKKKLTACLVLSMVVAAMMPTAAFAHGHGRGTGTGHHGGGYRRNAAYATCPVQDCTTLGIHAHDGTYYSCAQPHQGHNNCIWLS